MCADSAHKTLPVLTGGAYLHVAKGAEELLPHCRSALSLFASTSPSYLILQSLDLANKYLSDGYRERLAEAVIRVRAIKERLCALGLPPEPSEELKIVLNATRLGYSGTELAEHLRTYGAECEFSDGELTVLMITPENTDGELEIIPTAIAALERRAPIHREAPPIPRSPRAMSIRDAVLSLSESIPTELAEGRVLAAPTVSCPPAIPIAVSGELITREAIDTLLHYGIDAVEVVAP
jgi:arginine/lysine/ornithine decarboxylase